MTICYVCRRELKIGQRVIPNHILVEAPEGSGFEAKLSDIKYQHASCFDADDDDPRYDDAGNVIPRPEKGYIRD